MRILSSELINISVLYYDGFVEFEVVLVFLMLSRLGINTIALENREYKSDGNQRFLPDKLISDVNTDDLDLLIIPGGEPAFLQNNKTLKTFIGELIEKEKTIAAICGGTELLARYGFLDGIRCTGNSAGVKETDESYKYFNQAILVDESVVKDGNIITAKGQAFIEFAAFLSKETGIIKDDQEMNGHIQWFKNITN